MGCLKHDNELSGCSIRCGKFLDQLTDKFPSQELSNMQPS